MRWTRRQFIETVGTAVCAATVQGWRPRRPVSAIAVVGTAEDRPYDLGALLGIDEGRRSAELLRRPLEFMVVPAVAATVVTGLVEELYEGGVVGVVTALPAAAQARAEEASAALGLVVVDARASRPDSPHRKGVFRTGLPKAAYARAARAVGAPVAAAVLWDPDLFRYGAQQLNERYRRRFHQGMTGEAWAGWMAVKVLTEAVLRAGDGDRERVMEQLGGSRAAFDGHKGTPLAFTARGHTLAQPLYVRATNGLEEVAWPGGAVG